MAECSKCGKEMLQVERRSNTYGDIDYVYKCKCGSIKTTTYMVSTTSRSNIKSWSSDSDEYSKIIR